MKTFNFLYNIIFVFFYSLVLLQFKNNSNFSVYVSIPVITALTAKYIFGDIDEGYQWSLLDGIYWVVLYIISVMAIYLYNILLL